MDNKKYSIFIIGMFGIPSHLERFIRILKKTNPIINITLFTDREQETFSQDVLSCVGEYIQCKFWTGWPYRLWKFRKWFDIFGFRHHFKNISKGRHYDIVNIHYPSYLLSYVMKYIARMCDKIVVSPWGSDVLRVKD